MKIKIALLILLLSPAAFPFPTVDELFDRANKSEILKNDLLLQSENLRQQADQVYPIQLTADDVVTLFNGLKLPCQLSAVKTAKGDVQIVLQDYESGRIETSPILSDAMPSLTVERGPGGNEYYVSSPCEQSGCALLDDRGRIVYASFSEDLSRVSVTIHSNLRFPGSQFKRWARCDNVNRR